MEGKPGSHKRALRRHHAGRKKALVQKNLRHYFMHTTDLPTQWVGMYARTPKVCSCFMCGNPRRFHGEPTIQERREMSGPDEPALYPKPPKVYPPSVWWATLGKGL